MAINPNTDFTSGAVLTAAQQNRFPRGIVAYNANTSTDSTITVEEQEVAPVTFTAVANRLYRLSYFEPGFGGTSTSAMTMRIRQTSITGTVLGTSNVYNSVIQQQSGMLLTFATFGAGSVTVLATLQCSAGTGSATRSATAFAVLSVEDCGPY